MFGLYQNGLEIWSAKIGLKYMFNDESLPVAASISDLTLYSLGYF